MNAQLELFYNTINLRGQELKDREFRTGTQNRLILDCFRDRPTALLTSFEVRNILHLHTTPVTSIRRAMTDLTKLGYLEMTDVMREGEFGTINHTWKLRK